MVYLHFPTNLTEEELMLQTKYTKLKKKVSNIPPILSKNINLKSVRCSVGLFHDALTPTYVTRRQRTYDCKS